MKREELEALGMTKEQIDTVLNAHHVELNAVKTELQKANDDLDAANQKVKTTEEALKKFEGVDLDAQNATIESLKNDLKRKDAEHQEKLAERDFRDILNQSILAAKGKDVEMISRLLNIDELKASKNQKEDIANAIKALSDDDKTRGMFETASIQENINLPGRIGRPAPGKNYLDEQYKGNPYYRPSTQN